ncbi:OmpA family protein [Brevundimonas sp. NIBR11]|uniref:OmpA family protein n=1 Tax=Brevundimonas sp. NIBR11 TaxID=3015999 RepID=UPI0022F03243|nr:OmpA family protein [Brevundimonas sp. NIBR11]WGM32444.1 Outer membrane protein A [Brevundimonas sp. NIBR11]
MRIVPALLATSALAACSPPADDPKTPPPATPSAQVAPQTGTVGGLSASGAGLTGEVSGLSGDITAFRVEETATQTIVEIAADVLFAFDKSDLSTQAPAQLRRAADLIRQGGSGPVQVVGYTDSHGEDAYNLALSQRRAASVVAWLRTTDGIPADRLVAEGRGEADPVAPNEGADGNDYPEGRAMNRRVTITIPKA